MRNKIIAAAASGLLLSGFAFADDMDFYFGGNLGYNKLGYYSELKDDVSTNTGTIKSHVPSFGLLGGVDFHEHFGAELGYDFYKKAKASFTTGDDYGMKLNNLHVDVLGYMPVEHHVDLVGSVGLGRMRVKEVNNTYSAVDADSRYSKIGFRLGAGVQYNIDYHFATRAMINYQKVGKKNDLPFVKSDTSFNLALTYTL